MLQLIVVINDLLWNAFLFIVIVIQLKDNPLLNEQYYLYNI